MSYIPYKLKDVSKKEASNGFKAVSTFSGAGGSCLGLKLAGFEVLYANEFIPAAQEVYLLNHNNTYLEKKDIRKISPKEILNKTNLKKGELDLLEGSPPCAPFSQCGLGNQSWGKIKKYSDTKQRVDDLFMEFNRLLKGLQPKMFITENVNALSFKQNKTMFNTIYTHLKHCGYDVYTYIFNSLYYNVPQQRKRLFFIGVRNDLNITYTPPIGNNKMITIGEAVPFWSKKEHPELNIRRNTLTYKYLIKAQNKKKQIKDIVKEERGKASWFNQIILYSNTYSPTITQRNTFWHDTFPRLISIDELKRIHTFPDDFKLTGSHKKQWERIGRSVPPRLMESIAINIKKTLEGT